MVNDMDPRHSWSPIAKTYHPLSCGSIDGTDDFPHDKGVIRALNSTYRPNKLVFYCHSVQPTSELWYDSIFLLVIELAVNPMSSFSASAPVSAPVSTACSRGLQGTAFISNVHVFSCR